MRKITLYDVHRILETHDIDLDEVLKDVTTAHAIQLCCHSRDGFFARLFEDTFLDKRTKLQPGQYPQYVFTKRVMGNPGLQMRINQYVIIPWEDPDIDAVEVEKVEMLDQFNSVECRIRIYSFE